MLHDAFYSASAFDSFEQLLASRGESAHAEEVFLAGRRERRLSDLRTGNPLTWLFFASDWFQEYVLGYGRIARWPILWSIVIICVGMYFFRNVAMMEPTNKNPPRYSPVWYSIELFLPVVDLGVAKDWRPSSKSKHLPTYARFHQLSGWVLIPVALAAITGFAR
jgi:hypothetical protein